MRSESLAQINKIPCKCLLVVYYGELVFPLNSYPLSLYSYAMIFTLFAISFQKEMLTLTSSIVLIGHHLNLTGTGIGRFRGRGVGVLAPPNPRPTCFLFMQYWGKLAKE